MAGKVLVNEERAEKSGFLFNPQKIKIRLKEPDHPYVSRGGVKLEGALEHFKIQVRDLHCLDIGASTGGFTDCLLQKGAKKVYALDVGTAQLHQKLRNNCQVKFKENYNARYFKLKDLQSLDPQLLTKDFRIQLVVMDVSFISIRRILPSLYQELPRPWRFLGLVKPQFEAGPQEVQKGGLIKDPQVRQRVLQDLKAFASRLGLDVLGSVPAKIKGDKGNQEFFLYVQAT